METRKALFLEYHIWKPDVSIDSAFAEQSGGMVLCVYVYVRLNTAWRDEMGLNWTGLNGTYFIM